MNIQNLNPFSAQFLKFNKKEQERVEELGRNSIGQGLNDKSVIGDLWLNNLTPGGLFDATGISFASYFDSKAARIRKYREMANYPEVNSAVTMICDEAINEGNAGEVVEFEIKNTEGLKRKTIRDLRDEWDVVVNELFNFKETGWELFKCYLVDAELYFEIVLSDDGKDIIALKQLPAYTMTPIYQEGEIIKYIQQTEDETHVFEADQIVYVNYGEYGEDKTDVRGYLDPCVSIYDMIRNLEASAVIAQIVRAPERRIFNIECGKVSPQKAEQQIQKMMHNYRKKMNFDPTTGQLSAGDRFQAMTEDFFFAKFDGQGTSVETLQSSQNLEQLIELPNYFLRKLYKSLHIPSTRWGGGILAGKDEGQGTYNNKMDIEREELNFTKFIERISRRFCKIFYKVFIIDLKLKEFDPKLLTQFNYEINLVPNNHYREYRDMELMKERLDMISQYDGLRMSPENPNGIFAEEYFLKNIVGFTQSELDLNADMKKEQMDEEKIKTADAEEVSFGDGVGGLGGGGGSSFGGLGGGLGGGESSSEEPGAPEPAEPAGGPEEPGGPEQSI